MNGWLSVLNDAYSVNLAAPNDSISNVTYIVADASNPLPVPNASFDTFISPVSVNLIGLGRYGDALDASAIPNLISELDRIMKPDAVLYVSVVYGPDRIFSIIMSFPLLTIKKLFLNWEVENYLIDHQSTHAYRDEDRFTKDLDTKSSYSSKNENIIFIKFNRKLD